MADRFTYDVFLSHNSKDKPRVRKLAEELRAAGLRVWFDEWVIKPGDDIYLAIERGLEAARAQVLCLSPAALGSDWVALERSTVLFRDPTNAGRRFIPLLLADCELPDALRRYKYVDYRQETKAAFDELLAACRSETESARARAEGQTREEARSSSRSRPSRWPCWNASSRGTRSWVYSVAVSPDGTWAASGSRDKTVKIWDLETGECRATLQRAYVLSGSVAITPDGKRILSGIERRSVRVWDAIGTENWRSWIGTQAGLVGGRIADNAHALSGGSR